MPPDAGDDAHWAAWRGRFPALDEAIYLNTASHGARSDRVERALQRYLHDWTLDPPWETAWREVVEDAERRFGRLTGAPAGTVVLVPSVTDALQRVLSALPGENRPKVVLSGREWISSHHVVQAWPGLEPVVVDPALHPDDDGFLARIDAATRLVVVSQVCYRTGYRTDLGRVAERARAVGAKVFVDAFQAAGVVPTDVVAEGVDFYTAGSLKFLLGVSGVAFLYLRDDHATRLVPGLSGWRGQRRPMHPRLDPVPDAHRFSGGTWPVPNAYAAAAGLGLLEEAGPARIADRVASLVATFQTALDAVGLPCLTPRDPDRRGPIVVVPLPGAEALRAALRAEGVICAARDDGVRFSFHAYTTEAEARRAAARLADLVDEGTHHA